MYSGRKLMIAGNCMASGAQEAGLQSLTVLRSDVLGRSRESSETGSIMCLAGAARNGSQDGFAAGPQSAGRCHGVLVSQPPSRLPNL